MDLTVTNKIAIAADTVRVTLAATGGEDFELCACLPDAVAAALGDDLTRVGTVCEGPPGVRLLGPGGEPVEARGFEHPVGELRRWRGEQPGHVGRPQQRLGDRDRVDGVEAVGDDDTEAGEIHHQGHRIPGGPFLSAVGGRPSVVRSPWTNGRADARTTAGARTRCRRASPGPHT